MLTISRPLGAAQLRTYYAQEFSNAHENYYTAADVIEGQWHGRLAARWGLIGPVDDEQFQRPAEGQHPFIREQLVRYQRAHRTRYPNDGAIAAGHIDLLETPQGMQGGDVEVTLRNPGDSRSEQRPDGRRQQARRWLREAGWPLGGVPDLTREELRERTRSPMARSLVDTSVLIYSRDRTEPKKRLRAIDLINGLAACAEP